MEDSDNPQVKLTPGKSYTLYLDVTPVNNAENVVPTQVKVNIKVSNPIKNTLPCIGRVFCVMSIRSAGMF